MIGLFTKNSLIAVTLRKQTGTETIAIVAKSLYTCILECTCCIVQQAYNYHGTCNQSQYYF